MRPLKLTLEGFYGVRDGMRRDSLTLDLESLPEGLIALTGPNGAGKTTIMDNLHPYPIMPSHSSKLSVDAFSYWDHICAPTALKELEWEHDGIRYRSSFSFRKPGKTGKAEYFLAYRSMDGTWRPVSLPLAAQQVPGRRQRCDSDRLVQLQSAGCFYNSENVLVLRGRPDIARAYLDNWNDVTAHGERYRAQ